MVLVNACRGGGLGRGMCGDGDGDEMRCDEMR